jgi:RNA polymerase sigma-70 factor, ECF subfamily
LRILFEPFTLPRRQIGGAGVAETDGDIIARIKAGDQLALKTLYARHHVKIFRFAMRIVKSAPAAEDVVSEVFLDVWRSAAQFEGRSEASTFLLAVARNKAYSALRKRREDELDEDDAAKIEDQADTPETSLQKKNKGDILRACLSKLSREHREVMDLVYYHDKSVEETAAIVGVPEGTVKTRMFHARKRLAELAKAAGIDRGWP